MLLPPLSFFFCSPTFVLEELQLSCPSQEYNKASSEATSLEKGSSLRIARGESPLDYQKQRPVRTMLTWISQNSTISLFLERQG